MEANPNLHQLFNISTALLRKVQDFFYGDNPVNAALAQINQQDLQTFYEALLRQPAKLMELQFRWWQGQLDIYRNVLERAVDKEQPPLATAPVGDRRFISPLWQEQPNFDLLSQSYLHFSKIVADMLDSVEGLSPAVRQRLHFFTRQMINALAPSNFLWTNPEVLQQTVQEGGMNLIRGLEIFRDDVANSGKYLRVRMTGGQFQLGKDLAATPGAVVFENDICQLIQYEALGDEVFQTPLLIVPPFINKFYVLDLREHNSFVHWARSQGHTVFLISWRNPTQPVKTTYEDLMLAGVLAATDAIEAITGERKVNGLGYCIGGTLLAATQAYAVAKRERHNPIKSATYLATILDFANPGMLGVFINEPVIQAMEALDALQGFCDGRHLAVTFSLLRENTLYWNYYIENYLKGKEPSQFDILYWNSDGTNIPAAVHSFLLRRLYLHNELVQPGKIRIDGVGLNLGRVKTPNFFISTQEDHISLWPGTFRGAAALGGPSTLLLGESGHVAGIINPPSRNKYGYYHNPEPFVDEASWLAGAEFVKRSWWLAWQEWVQAYAGDKVPARPLGSTDHPPLAPAPGSYVQVNLI